MNDILILQSAFAGVTNGFVYGLIGLGIAVIFRGTRVVNVMQGGFVLIAGVTAYLLLQYFQVPLFVAYLGGVFAGGTSGFLSEWVLIRPTLHRGGAEENYLLVTLGGSFAISAAVFLLFGRNAHTLPGIGGEGSDALINVFGATVRIHAIWVVVISLGVMISIKLFYSRTHIGQSMMAASIDSVGAAITGINVPLMRSLTFILGGLVGGVAGVLVAPLLTVQYAMGLPLTLKGFAAATLGGLTNPFGAIVGGVTLGLAESMAVLFISSGYQNAIAMIIMILIMIVLPYGILGRKGRSGG